MTVERYMTDQESADYKAALAEARYRKRQLAKRCVTPEEYVAMLDAQGGVCAGCGSPCKTGRRLAVDHCHASGRVRGLLCSACNNKLGSYERVKPWAEPYLADPPAATVLGVRIVPTGRPQSGQ